MRIGGTRGIRNRFYSLVFHAYPAGFRRKHGEAMLGTLADMRDAGDSRGLFRQTASLFFGGQRERWLSSTNGSLALTLRQGLAWGALWLAAVNAGGRISNAVYGAVVGWEGLGPADFALEFVLALGWLATFYALASSRRRLGLGALGLVFVVLVAQHYTRQSALSSPVMWEGPLLSPAVSFAIQDTAFPLLAASLLPAGFRLTARPRVWLLGLGLAWWGLLWLSSSLATRSLFELLFLSNSLTHCALILSLFVLGLWSDPRWSVAIGLVAAGSGWLMAFQIGTDLSSGVKGMVLALVLPAAVGLLVLRRRRAARA